MQYVLKLTTIKNMGKLLLIHKDVEKYRMLHNMEKGINY